jgi:hypothetical protein
MFDQTPFYLRVRFPLLAVTYQLVVLSTATVTQRTVAYTMYERVLPRILLIGTQSEGEGPTAARKLQDTCACRGAEPHART